MDRARSTPRGVHEVVMSVEMAQRVDAAKRGIRGKRGVRASPNDASGAPLGGVGLPLNRPARPQLELLVPVEVARRLLLEPQPVVLGRLLQELRRLLEDVLVT